MLDIRKIKENPEGVKAALRAKEVDCDATIDRILELDEQRRTLIADTEARKARQNKVSKDIPAMKKAGLDVSAIFAEMAELKAGLAADADLEGTEVAQSDDFTALQGINNHIFQGEEYGLHIGLVYGTRLLDAFGHLTHVHIPIRLYSAVILRSCFLVTRIDSRSY